MNNKYILNYNFYACKYYVWLDKPKIKCKLVSK